MNGNNVIENLCTGCSHGKIGTINFLLITCHNIYKEPNSEVLISVVLLLIVFLLAGSIAEF